MSATTIPEAIYAQLDRVVSRPVSSEVRRQDDPTPAVVYEVTAARWDLAIDGFYVGTGQTTVRIDCVAPTALQAWSLAMLCRGAIGGRWTQGKYELVLVSLDVSQTKASIDDGTADATRVATIVAEFQFKETT
jgi:hypothetical protein